jgi:hypothetical protein
MKKIQHHFISEAYLKNFTNEDDKICVIGENYKIFETNPNNIFKENHYNTVRGSLFIEDEMSEIEGKYNQIIQNKIKKKLRLDQGEKIIMAFYIATIFNRVRIRREMMEKSLKDMVSWADNFRGKDLSGLPPASGKTINIESIKKSLENFNPEFAVSSFKNSIYTTGFIYHMKWRFLIIQNDDVFITSDNPAHLCRPRAENKYGPNAFGARAGFKHEDAELTIPITPKTVILAGWINNTDLDYFTIPDSWVSQFNWRTMRSANWLVSNKRKKFEEILKKSK